MSRERIAPKQPVPAPATYRQSLLSMADKCQYGAFLYAKHDGGVASHPMFTGTAFHAVAARATETLLATGNERIAPDDVKAIMVEVLEENPGWVIPAANMDSLRVMLTHWAEAFVLPDPSVRVEQTFSMEVAGQTVTGTIDLLWVKDNTLYVRDYKAGFYLYPQDEVFGKDVGTGQPRGAKAAQLITYAALVADGKSESFTLPRGVNFFDLAFVFPMYKMDEGPLAERGGKMSRPELLEHRLWLDGLVKKTARAFEDNRYTAVPGTHCSRCPANTECPLPARVRGGSPFERDPKLVAEDWVFLDTDAKALLAELKAYAGVHGPIPVGVDQELSFSKVESSKMPAKAKEALMNGEIPAGPMFKSSVSTRFGLRKRAS